MRVHPSISLDNVLKNRVGHLNTHSSIMLTLRQLISPRDLIQRCLISMTKGELFRDQWLCVEIIYWHLGDRMKYITGTYA